jgi:hypothetical protein
MVLSSGTALAAVDKLFSGHGFSLPSSNLDYDHQYWRGGAAGGATRFAARNGNFAGAGFTP